jgi:hypothetical protein
VLSSKSVLHSKKLLEDFGPPAVYLVAIDVLILAHLTCFGIPSNKAKGNNITFLNFVIIYYDYLL